ncbi:hypothetical protein KDL29_15410 [bacterium]|nr:hypothetical protein [bacterium]
MATLADNIADYHEFDAPLKRSMRRWWAGPGRLWLVAIGACGFMTVVLSALNSTFGATVVGAGTILGNAAFIVVQLKNASLVLGMYNHAVNRHGILTQMLNESAIPSQRGILARSFMASILLGWPFIACFYLTSLLVNLVLFQILFKGQSGETLLESLLSSSSWPMPYIQLAMLAIAFLYSCQLRYLRRIMLLACLYPVLTNLIYLVVRSGSSLVWLEAVDFPNQYPMLTGCLLAVLAFCLAIAIPSRDGKTFMVLGIITLQLLTLFADLFVHIDRTSGNQPVYLQMLWGIQNFLVRMPFANNIHAMQVNGNTEGVLSVSVLWNKDWLLPLGMAGYLLETVLNLAWLAGVFLFCRWAVGRSAGREA